MFAYLSRWSLILLMLALPFKALAADNQLVSMLTSQLGVSEEQASGGLGALLATAAPNLSGEALGSLGGIIPNMDGLIDNGSSLLGSNESSGGLLNSVLGSSGNSLLGLNNAFSSLGLDSAMVSQFSGVLLDYVNSEGGQALMQQLKSALLP